MVISWWMFQKLPFFPAGELLLETCNLATFIKDFPFLKGV